MAVPPETPRVPPIVALDVRAPPETVKLPACVEPVLSVRLPPETVTVPRIVPQLTAVVPFTTRPLTLPPAAIVRFPPCPLSELLTLPEP